MAIEVATPEEAVKLVSEMNTRVIEAHVQMDPNHERYQQAYLDDIGAKIFHAIGFTASVLSEAINLKGYVSGRHATAKFELETARLEVSDTVVYRKAKNVVDRENIVLRATTTYRVEVFEWYKALEAAKHSIRSMETIHSALRANDSDVRMQNKILHGDGMQHGAIGHTSGPRGGSKYEPAPDDDAVEIS